MNEQGTTITTPAGRIVWGHPCKPRHATDQQNNKKFDDAGQPIMETSFGLAIPVDQFQAEVWPVMAQEIATGYPNGAPGNFSYKITQPHEIDNRGKPYSEREGYAGHVVIAISTTLEPPSAFKWVGSGWQQMQPDDIKCGDWVQVETNFKVNVPRDRTHTPSIYVNPRGIAFVGYGDPISSGFQVDPNAAFGNGPAALPPGASATPIGGAPGGVGMPGSPAGMPAAAPGGMPGAPAAAPGAPVPPPTTAPSPVAAPARPLDPTHIHDNGNGTEQWFVNGVWDGGAHPAPAAQQMPPPASGFVAQAAGMPGAPTAAAPAPAGMPGMPGPR